MTDQTPDPRLKLRIVFGDSGMVGPGKAELLERIEATGSIADAGRAMGMSYKRAWQLVQTMNAIFCKPLVVSTRGGAKGGGARVTELGLTVLAEYRALERGAYASGAPHITKLQSLVKPADTAE
ncbi:MAG: molybdenum-binding transcriptional regulator [Pseudomonadota bacterium]